MVRPPSVEARGIRKSFGALRALDAVDLDVPAGTFHAIVGENGAGKSTLAKCLLGFYRPDAGVVKLDGVAVTTPAEARHAGLGMVFQHFTLAPSMTVAENLVLARPDLPALLNWRMEHEQLSRFLESAPFQVDLEARVEHLAAGQKQKVEILKQLYLETRVLILDEPTSVLTPAEADEVMLVLSGMVRRGSLSVILITHKLREVMAFADDVTILRRGRWVASNQVRHIDIARIAELMISNSPPPEHLGRTEARGGDPALEIRGLCVRGDHGLPALKNVNLLVRSGEILGIAGVSGNGQRELVQAIGGQRDFDSGSIRAFGTPYHPSRAGIQSTGLFTLPEEPLQNATVAGMSVAENLALRSFDRAPIARFGFLLDRAAIRQSAEDAVRRFSVRTPSIWSPIRNLSGGNVQRAVLARELAGGEARIMVVANPCFGLDFAATAFMHNQLIDLRNRGGSVLLVSEDLDELMKIADRIVVMSGGEIAHETLRADLDLAVVGRYMGGHAAG
jgi:general nucleoside transport system ATP-binding protein